MLEKSLLSYVHVFLQHQQHNSMTKNAYVHMRSSEDFLALTLYVVIDRYSYCICACSEITGACVYVFRKEPDVMRSLQLSRGERVYHPHLATTIS